MNHIFSFWNIDLNNIIVLAAISILYFYTISFRRRSQSIYFIASIILIVLCIASPLNYIGENYLFSAHMLSHVLLLLIAAPLLVAAIPLENRFKNAFLFISKKIHEAPLVSWIVGVGVMWLLHIPYIFSIMMPTAGMHQDSVGMDMLMSVNNLTLLIGGMIFCWPVINPYKEYRIPSLTAVLYLSMACVFCSLLGLLITFAPSGTYTRYISSDMNGFLSVIRNQWGISKGMDQQMAGLIMWVPCCFIYLTASMVILIKWFEKKEGRPRITQMASIE